MKGRVGTVICAALLAIAGCQGDDDSPAEPEVQPGGGIIVTNPETGEVTSQEPLPPSEGEFPPGEEPPPQPAPAPAVESPILVGAGDIGRCDRTTDDDTAKILDRLFANGEDGVVFTTGDNAYSSGTAAEFTECYAPTWGRHRARTRPTPGNHDYVTSGASGYFNYFGEAAGEKGKGYYSYDLGEWHLVALNSNCGAVGGCDEGSPQLEWLKQDLAASGRKCVAAYWHHSLISSGDRGYLSGIAPFWRVLQDAGAEFVVVGHEHHYERFAPVDADGLPDPQGIPEFLVGTGGTSLRDVGSPQAGSVALQNSVHGVVKFTLHPDSYEWEFLPVDGQDFSDSGRAYCR